VTKQQFDTIVERADRHPPKASGGGGGMDRGHRGAVSELRRELLTTDRFREFGGINGPEGSMQSSRRRRQGRRLPGLTLLTDVELRGGHQGKKVPVGKASNNTHGKVRTSKSRDKIRGGRQTSHSVGKGGRFAGMGSHSRAGREATLGGGDGTLES